MPVQATTGLSDPYVSLGLTSATDFTSNFPFINLMLTARHPFSNYENGAYFEEYLDAQAEVGKTYREVFGKHFPAMSMIVVSALVEDEAKVEIEATAHLS